MTSDTHEKKILQMLEKKDTISIREIAVMCGISENTARRDLTSIEEKGLIRRTHGGAILTSSIGAAGVSPETGLSGNDEKEASITTRMADAASKVFLLCDSSRAGKSSCYSYWAIYPGENVRSAVIIGNRVEGEDLLIANKLKDNVQITGNASEY